MHQKKHGDDLFASEIFYSPIMQALESSMLTRNCPHFTDEAFLRAGVGRCLEDVRSGRHWIQRAARIFKLPVTVDRFFTAMKSKRRLEFTKRVAESVRALADKIAPQSYDPFADHPEMKDFAVYAADGHSHGASAHEIPIDDKKRSVGHFYAINLRTQTMIHLDVARPKVKAEHDIAAMKRLGARTLRMGEPQGRKVLLGYDPAIYDFQQWYSWKMQGLYIVTRKKSNTELLYCGQKDFDRNDPRNNGVISDKVGAPSNSDMVREIVYVDPTDGKQYIFLTNEMTLPPGLIAFVYKKRWDIEKVYDEFKNKIMESRAWAKSVTAKCIQAKLMALTHNLMLMLEWTLDVEEGVTDLKVEHKRNQQLAKDQKKAANANRRPNPLATKRYKAVQRSAQFIRRLQDTMTLRSLWRPAVEELRPLMVSYLQ